MAQEPTSSQPDDQAATPDEQPPALDDQVPEPESPPPPEPPRRRRPGLKIAIGVVAGLVVLAGAGVVAVITLFGEDVPEVGECMTDAEDPTDIAVIDCGSDQAAWRVVGHDGSRTEDEFDRATREDICQAFPDWENALWLRTNLLSGEGEVVCLVATGPAAQPE